MESELPAQVLHDGVGLVQLKLEETVGSSGCGSALYLEVKGSIPVPSIYWTSYQQLLEPWKSTPVL